MLHCYPFHSALLETWYIYGARSEWRQFQIMIHTESNAYQLPLSLSHEPNYEYLCVPYHTCFILNLTAWCPVAVVISFGDKEPWTYKIADSCQKWFYSLEVLLFANIGHSTVITWDGHTTVFGSELHGRYEHQALWKNLRMSALRKHNYNEKCRECLRTYITSTW